MFFTICHKQVESSLTTAHSAFTEHDYPNSPEGPETSRNTSYLAQFDSEPSPPRVRRSSRMSVVSMDFLSDSSLLSPVSGAHRKTADLNELKAMLGMSPGQRESVKESISPIKELNKESISPIKESISPIKGSISPIKGSISPIKELNKGSISPIKESISPIKESISPIKESTSPTKETKSSFTTTVSTTSATSPKTSSIPSVSPVSPIRPSESAPKPSSGASSQSVSAMDSSSSRIDAEETAALQGLLQSSQSDRSALDTSNMDISRSDSDTSAGDSRRATLGLGEMKAMLLQELDRYDRRSSVSQRVSQRVSLTETDVLSSQPLLELLKQNPISPAKTRSSEPMNESESTIDLQQYAAQLREEISRTSTVSAPSKRESLTADLQSVAKEVLSMAALEQNEVAQRTDALLQRMSAQPSTAAVAAMDDTITEDLRRLSQLLVAQPEEKPRFSPLVARSGTKQVIHSVKSSQKYGQSAVEEVRVINSMPARPLFQEAEKEEERAQAEEEEAEEEKKKAEAEKEEQNPVETSINLDAYFLPKSFRSVLEDSTPQAESIDYETTEKSDAATVGRLPSVDSLPSDIQENSIQMEESSLGDWDEKEKGSVEKVEDSLEGILNGKQPDRTDAKPDAVKLNETPTVPPIGETPTSETPISKTLTNGTAITQPNGETPSNEPPTTHPINEPPITQAPSAEEQRLLSLRSRLASIDFFREKASLQLSRRCQQILDSRGEVQQLCALFGQIREAKQQQTELEASWKRAEQDWKEAEQSFAREIQKEKPAMQDDATFRQQQEEEAKLKGEVKLLEEDLGLVFALQSDRSYSILLRRNRLLIAAISVQFVGGGKVSLKVVPKTSCSKVARKRMEARLPVKQEKVVSCSEMREWVCRCIWIVNHSF